MEVEELDPALGFLQTLWALDHALQSRSKAMSTLLGVTGQQRFALRLIGMRGRTTSGDLCRLMHLHPSTLTGLLRRLEERRLVVRRPDPDDARRALLRLTPLGKRSTGPNEVCIEAAVRRVLKKVSRSNRIALEKTVATLVAELEDRPR